MLRFTIRDLLWLMVVVGLAVALWLNQRRYLQSIETTREQSERLKKESKVWEARANSLRNDMLTGTNKNTEIEFIPGGIKYVGKKAPAAPLPQPGSP
jgi:cell division protein FtsB